MPKTQYLNLRQARFAEAYVRHRNGSRAAREAGYSAVRGSASATAQRLLDHDPVKERVRALEADTERALAYDTAQAIQGLRDAFAIAKEKRKPSTMITAYREIGNILGYYPPKLKRAPTPKAK